MQPNGTLRLRWFAVVGQEVIAALCVSQGPREAVSLPCHRVSHTRYDPRARCLKGTPSAGTNHPGLAPSGFSSDKPVRQRRCATIGARGCAPRAPPTVERQERRIGGSGRLQPRGVGPGAAGRRSGQNEGRDPGSAREAVSVDSSTRQQDSCGERAERCPASGLSPDGEVIRDGPGRISLPGSAIVRFENSLPRT